jgi:hypothetical protein
MKFIACCVLAVTLGVGGCKRGPAISEDPAVVGQTITLTGKIDKIYDPAIVKLDTDRGDVIVVTPPNRPPLKAGDRVSVTGDVRRVTVAEFERDFALDADVEVEAVIDKENVVAAREIRPA